MGGFRMRVRRSLSNGQAAAAAAAPAPVAAAPAPAPAAPAPAPAAAPAVASGSYDSDEEVDHTLESLTAITSAKVGCWLMCFCTGKTLHGGEQRVFLFWVGFLLHAVKLLLQLPIARLVHPPSMVAMQSTK